MSINHADTPPRPILSESGAERGITDLPTEVLHIIVGHLWQQKQTESANWYNTFDDLGGWSAKYRRQMCKDALAFSSCSKALRQRIFLDWIVQDVTVRLDQKELERFATLTLDVRCRVSRLTVQPGQSSKADATHEIPICFHHFIELLPNLVMLSVWWPIAPDDGRFQQLPSCDACPLLQDPEKMVAGSPFISPVLDTVRIRAALHDWLTRDGSTDATHAHERIACLVRKLQWPHLRTVTLSVKAPNLLTAENPQTYLSSIIEACNALRQSSITDASLAIEMTTDGRTPEVASYDMFSLIFHTCWIGSNLRRMDVSLVFYGEAAYRFEEVEDLAARELITYGSLLPCPATRFSSSRLSALAATIKTTRPELKGFSLMMRCIVPHAEHYVDKPWGPAQWKLEYPSTASIATVTDGEATPHEERIDYTMTLAIDEDSAVSVIVHDKHQGSACCFAVREHERAIVADVAADARADPSGYGFYSPDEYSDLGDSDLDLSDSDVDSEDSGWETEDEA